MNKFRFTIQMLAIAIFTLAFASMAQAQATRTWVSGVGDDVNPCSRTAPCKTFAGAISKTAAGGEIDCLDPGGFGTVTITKSITIDGTTGSGFGSILSSGVTGVNVNDSASGSPNTSIVRLRNLSINGAGTTPGTIGVNFTSGKNVYIEHCIIFGFKSGTGHGVSVNLTVNASQTLTVTDSIISENLNDGIRLANSGGAINAFIDNTRFEKNGANGVECVGTSVAVIRNSSFSFNTTSGLSINNASSSANVENSMFQGSPNHGINALAGTVRLRGNNVTNNANGLTCAGGTISSYGDNAVQGNGTALNGCPDPLPPLAKK
ncbi:MAG TPA: right-handed parallel beta-helix repeat-containing protein [Pyrinomonadaceae bacterium]|nr:right-handed parallel beta-helix repeat-containing protein [Pyrinomonadaceae bacterium]